VALEKIIIIIAHRTLWQTISDIRKDNNYKSTSHVMANDKWH